MCLAVLQNCVATHKKRALLVDTQHDLCFLIEECAEIAIHCKVETEISTVEGLMDVLTKSAACDEPPALYIIDTLPPLCEHYPTHLLRGTALHRLNLALQGIAHRTGAAVVVVNYTGFDEARMLGSAWVHAPSVLIHLKRESPADQGSGGGGSLSWTVLKV